jgi:hypothetical protein
MKRTLLAIAALVIGALVFTSCSKDNPIAPSVMPEQGQMVFALDAASDNIASGQVTITKSHLTQVLPIAIAGYTGTVAFNGIQIGHWNIQVQLFDADGVEIYSGDGAAIVTKNTTTTVTVRVQHNTGNLQIIVEVPGLLLWNKLGSADEVTHSAEGPDGQVDGALDYLAGQFGNGFKSQERTGDKNIPANYVKFENVKLQPQGCLEFWYQPAWSNASVGHIVDLIEYGTPGDISGLTFRLQYNDWQNIMALGVFDEGQQSSGHCVFVPEQTPGWSTSAPFHVACVWDANATNPNERAMVFVNGQKIGNSTADGSTNFVWSENKVLLISSRTYPGDWDRHNWEGGEGVIDNIKIWNYPKTDFSDRFME